MSYEIELHAFPALTFATCLSLLINFIIFLGVDFSLIDIFVCVNSKVLLKHIHLLIRLFQSIPQNILIPLFQLAICIKCEFIEAFINVAIASGGVEHIAIADCRRMCTSTATEISYPAGFSRLLGIVGHTARCGR